MKFSNFLFPESQSPDGDYDVIEESLREAELSEELGYDVVWLAEHNFDWPSTTNFGMRQTPTWNCAIYMIPFPACSYGRLV